MIPVVRKNKAITYNRTCLKGSLFDEKEKNKVVKQSNTLILKVFPLVKN